MERWYWIELIGFDNEAEDYGVSAFLSRNVSTTGVSLLFSHIDFIFNLDKEELSEKACSYFGHEYSKERRRQNWTRSQLKGLIGELQARGIKVFFSTFDMTTEITDTNMRAFNAQGTPERLVYVIKKINEKEYAGDIIIEKLKATLKEYGFDGLQLADGLSSNRLSIENGDFTLALCRESGISIPNKLMQNDTDCYVPRREWILKNARYEWICFIAREWEDFYEKLFARIDKPIMFNIAWTRDSFEALYRYGLDYAKCKVNRAFAAMIEENSATRAITHKADEANVDFTLDHRSSFTYEYALMQQNIRIMSDGLRQISLCPISDTMEQWDAIRHCPTELSRAIVKRFNNFVYRNGKFEVCCDAPHYCLSDGVSRSDWEWLAKQESYRIPTPDFIDGFTAVCNKNALYRDVKRYCEKKQYYGSALLKELVFGGLNLGAQTELSEVAEFKASRGLVVTDLNAYTEQEKLMLSRSPLPILTVGEDISLPITPSAVYNGKYISLALYNSDIKPDFNLLKTIEIVRTPKKTEHGEIWTEPLSYKWVDGIFFRSAAMCLNEAFGLDFCIDKSVKVTSFLSKNVKYLLLSNDLYLYSIPKIETNREITEATAIMKYDGYRVKTEGKTFSVRIPPKSIEIIKII